MAGSIFDMMGQAAPAAASLQNSWLQYLLGLDTNALNRTLGQGKLDLDKLLGQGQLDLGQGRLDLDKLLGTGKLDLGNRNADISERLGEGNLNLQQQLGLGKLNLDSALGYAGLGTQKDIANIGAKAQNIGDLLDLQGVMEQAGASRYGSDNSLAAALQASLSSERNAMTGANAQRDVANINNALGYTQESNKSNRFNSVAGLLTGVLNGVLPGLGFNVSLPNVATPVGQSQAAGSAEPDQKLLEQIADLKNQVGGMQQLEAYKQAEATGFGKPPPMVGGRGVGAAVDSGFFDPKRKMQQSTPVAQLQQPVQQPAMNPVMTAILGQMGQSGQSSLGPAPQFQSEPILTPKPVPVEQPKYLEDPTTVGDKTYYQKPKTGWIPPRLGGNRTTPVAFQAR